eukprot:5003813-Prymnesium_polylepis.1
MFDMYLLSQGAAPAAPGRREAGKLLEGALVGTSSRSAREWVKHEVELMLSSASVAEERTVAALGRATRALAELGGGKWAWQLRKEAERRRR